MCLRNRIYLLIFSSTFFQVLLFQNTEISSSKLIDSSMYAQTTQTQYVGRTPQEFGFENYLNLVKLSMASISQISPNISLNFPIGQNYPIRLVNVANSQQRKQPLIATGVVINGKSVKPFSSSDFIEIIEWHMNTLRGGLDKSRHLAIFSNQSTANKTTPVMDIVVFDPSTGVSSFMYNVNAVALVRDVIIASVNNQIFQSVPSNINMPTRPALPL